MVSVPFKQVIHLEGLKIPEGIRLRTLAHVIHGEPKPAERRYFPLRSHKASGRGLRINPRFLHPTDVTPTDRRSSKATLVLSAFEGASHHL